MCLCSAPPPQAKKISKSRNSKTLRGFRRPSLRQRWIFRHKSAMSIAQISPEWSPRIVTSPRTGSRLISSRLRHMRALAPTYLAWWQSKTSNSTDVSAILSSLLRGTSSATAMTSARRHSMQMSKLPWFTTGGASHNSIGSLVSGGLPCAKASLPKRRSSSTHNKKICRHIIINNQSRLPLRSLLKMKKRWGGVSPRWTPMMPQVVLGRAGESSAATPGSSQRETQTQRNSAEPTA